MTGESWYARYSEWHRHRAIGAMTNPFWIAWMVALTWIFARWFLAIVFTVWLAICTALAFRARRRN